MRCDGHGKRGPEQGVPEGNNKMSMQREPLQTGSEHRVSDGSRRKTWEQIKGYEGHSDERRQKPGLKPRHRSSRGGRGLRR